MGLFNRIFHIGSIILFPALMGLSQGPFAENGESDHSQNAVRAISGITESMPPNRENADSAQMVTEDTLVAGIVLEQSHPIEKPENRSKKLQAAVDRGKGLVTTGMTLHFLGLGISTIASIVSVGNPSGLDATASTVISLVSTGLQVTGPIFACAGASGVQDEAQKEGIASEEPFTAWRDYGRGWAYTGIGTGLALLSVALIAGNSQTSNNGDGSGLAVIVIPLVIAAAGMTIVGEVNWIQSLIHAKIYTDSYDNIPTKHSLSWSVAPFMDMERRMGLTLKAAF
jgi:hypothetical protein